MLVIDVWQYFLELFLSLFFCVLIPFASASTSISLRSSCFKNVASREISFEIFPSHFLLFRISPRRKLRPVYIPVWKFGNLPVSMLYTFAAILLKEQILTISPKWWGLLSVALRITSFSLSILVLTTALDQ